VLTGMAFDSSQEGKPSRLNKIHYANNPLTGSTWGLTGIGVKGQRTLGQGMQSQHNRSILVNPLVRLGLGSAVNPWLTPG
jgi:hypothetical protein